MRRRLLGSAALLLVLVPALGALDDKKEPDKPAAPKERYDALLQEYSTARADLLKQLRETTTEEDRSKLVRKVQMLPSSYAERFIEIAEKNTKDPVALDALLWVVRSVPPGKEADRAIALLNEDHAASPNLATVFLPLSRSPSPEAEQLLRTVLDKSTDKDVQGKACLALAKNLVAQSEKARRDKKADAAKLSKQAEETFERVLKEYADIKEGRATLGQSAKSELDELRSDKAVGKPAPEIEGEDIDGKKLKLSDYRGKVVVLTFWGHWCPPCRAMFPHERSLVKRMEDKPFALLGVNSDRDREDTKQKNEKEQITWRSFWNGGGSQGPIAAEWKVRGWPTIYLIDHQGVIRDKYLGSPGGEVLDRVIDELVKEMEEKK